MTTEEVQDFLVAEFGVNGKQVFEVSAKQAFVVTHFLEQLILAPETLIVEVEVAQELAQETFCLSWKEELSRTRVEKLSVVAEKLWEQ